MTAQAGGKRVKQICRQLFGDYKFTKAYTVVNSVEDVEKPADRNRADPKSIPTTFH